MNNINWQPLIDSKCIIIHHPFWSIKRDSTGALREVTILETTPDGEYITFEFMGGEIIEWTQKSRLEFIEKIDVLSSKFNGKWLHTRASYKGNPTWENSIGNVIVLGTSPSDKYIKLEYTRTDGTKNIRWEEKEEIILKYKLDDENLIRSDTTTTAEE